MPTARTAPAPHRRRWRRAGAALAVALLAAGLLGGCGTVAYYAQSVGGHLSLLHAARPVSDWLDDPATPEALKQRLQVAQRIRAFSVQALHLPDNASYHRYADVPRRAAVWSVTAAPADSLELKRWCYPVIGCAGYRGYYDEVAAQALGQQLQGEGWEVAVSGIPAYSTLGWLNWLGGDPLLSTFIHYPDGELARMVFHELAHQVVYVADDTTFNESFATAVERLGVTQWLAQAADEPTRAAYAAWDARRRDFRTLTGQTRAELADIYADAKTGTPGDQTWRVQKTEAMARFRQRYRELKARWAAAGSPFEGYDGWVARANNASFGLQAAYDQMVPGFEALFEREGRDWPRFYAAAARLAAQPPAQRMTELDELARHARHAPEARPPAGQGARLAPFAR